MDRNKSAGRRHGARLALLLLATFVLWGCSAPPKGGRWTRDDYHLGYGYPFLDRATLRDPVAPAGEAGDAAASLQDLSARIWLLSDNQRHELLGAGIRLYRWSLSDMYKACAIRPPQLDLFGQELFAEALDRTDAFVLHLGDACDVSNSVEFALFAWDMRRAPDGWLMAPGNHDGYFMGNVSRKGASWVKEWNETGERYEEGEIRIISRAMQKDDFLAYYLASMILQDSAWSGPLADRLGSDCAAIRERWSRIVQDSPPPTFGQYWQHLESLQAAVYRASVSAADGTTHRIDLSEELPADAGVTLRRIVWSIDAEEPWKSYLTQEIDISRPDGARPISVLVLDSSQYWYMPSMEHAMVSGVASVTGAFDLQLAGTHGNILETQVESVDWMMDAMRAEERLWVVAMHHPYADLGRVSPPRFDRIREAGGVPVTLSGHSHSGEIRWNHDIEREGAWLELNVGSLLDAPVEYRDFQVQQIDGRLAVSSRRFVVENQLRAEGLLADDRPGYRPSPGDSDYYMDYQRGYSLSADKSEIAVKRMVLASYLRMFRLFDTDESDPGGTSWPVRADGQRLGSHAEVLDEIVRLAAQSDDDIDVAELTHLLYGLRDYDRTRTLPEANRQALRAYRLSQAIWAGQAELETRTIEPHEVDPDISFLLLPAPVAPAPSEPATAGDAAGRAEPRDS